MGWRLSVGGGVGRIQRTGVEVVIGGFVRLSGQGIHWKDRNT